MPQHIIKPELKITDSRINKPKDALNVLVISSRYYDVMIYPDEIATFCEKLLEVPEVLAVMTSLLRNKEATKVE